MIDFNHSLAVAIAAARTTQILDADYEAANTPLIISIVKM